jgi:glucose-6-phosphate-specific signal transduction histidine kinase
VISVVDDGAKRPCPPSPGGRGIAGMRERAQAFGGSLEAATRPEGGFAVVARLPLPAPTDPARPAEPAAAERVSPGTPA